MRVILFALTGFGNEVMRELVLAGYSPELIVTRKEDGIFPHYNEVNLAEEARSLGIKVLYDVAGETYVSCSGADIIFIWSYSCTDFYSL